MKHEEIYHTCDRCGKKIQPFPSSFRPNHTFSKKRINLEAVTMDPTVFVNEVCRSVEKDTIKNNTILTLELSVITEYNKIKNTLELCKDCREEFEKFMNGEEIIDGKHKE